MSSLKARITEDMKEALRAGDKLRLGAVRMLLAAIKQREVDDRRDMTDGDVLQIVEKAIKQRREAAAQFAAANRSDLETKELEEARLFTAYLPERLSEAEINALIEATVQATAAAGARDMGKVMNALRPKLQGRADMGLVSTLVKARLAG
jgi:uncharacterized protein YqeY